MNNLSSIFRSFFVETYFIQLNAFNQYFTCIKGTIIFKALQKHRLLHTHGHLVWDKSDNFHLTQGEADTETQSGLHRAV